MTRMWFQRWKSVRVRALAGAPATAGLLAAGVFGLGVGLGAASAQDATRSAITTIDLKACKLLSKHKDGNSYLCPGVGSFKVYVAEGDLRFFVSAGPTPDKTQGAQQTLRPFNTIFKGKAIRTSMEWRNGGGAERTPYATIVRYYTEHDGAKGEVLVVSKVSAKESCHMAMIDARANENALEIARRVADQQATRFDCEKDEAKAEGAQGKSPM